MSWIAVGVGAVAVGAGVGSSLLSSGKKPRIPDYPKVNLDALQKAAISGNLAALPGASELASKVDQANLEQAQRLSEAQFPGLKAKALKNIEEQLSGTADIADTQAAIRNATAANFALGTGGRSQFSKFSVIGQLGRSVASQKQTGLANFLNLSTATGIQQFDPASMFLTADQRVNVALRESEQQFNVDLARAQIAAQPSKTSKALGAGLGVVSNLASGSFGAALGGIGGGGGGSSDDGYNYPKNFGPPPGTTGSTQLPNRFYFPGSKYGKGF